MDRTLVEIEDARRMVLDRVRPLDAEEVPLRNALGRVLAEEIVAPEPVPGFDNSAMDGYSVSAADTQAASEKDPLMLRLTAEPSAGHPAGVSLGEGEAIAISTGAMVPEGADAVIRVEDTACHEGEVEARAAVEPGRNIRRAGEDIRAGETVLGPGALIGPAELGVIGSAARPIVSCARRPRVHVVVTGDELIGPGEEMRPGAVRDSNAYTIPALAQAAGAEVAGVEHVGDDADATREAIGRALEADLAVVCGGVSVGVHDHVRPSLDALGAEELFWGVALRPGKPTW